MGRVGRVLDTRTKLVCTMGPASDGLEPRLIAAGMDVARVNLSHGTPDDHRQRVAAVRSAAAAAGRPVAVLADLSGPKVRLGEIAGGRAALRAGSRFVLRGDPGTGDATGAPTSYAGLAGDLRPGDRVLLADGAAELRVVAVSGRDVETEVVRGGQVGTRQGVNVPSERLSLSPLTDRDRGDIPRLLEYEVDYVAQSFVRRPEDVRELRALLGAGGPPIVAKIETRAAIEAIEAIVDEADAIMVARGDMGVELPFEEVPLVQKRLVRLALDAGVPSIVATQMLESMIEAPRPTRAEVSDVANAVLDGADAVMLSAETAAGAYPLDAADAAVRICRAVEEDETRELMPAAWRGPGAGDSPGAAVAAAAVALADADERVDAIACFTRTGRTAELVSGLRPTVPILACSSDALVLRRLALRYGIVPVAAASDGGAEDPVAGIAARLRAVVLAQGLVSADATVVVVGSRHAGAGPTQLEVLDLSS